MPDERRAALAQALGVQIRVLDTLVNALGEQRVTELVASLRAVRAVLDDLTAPSAAVRALSRPDARWRPER